MIIVKHMATPNGVGRGRYTSWTGSGGPSRAPPTPRQTGQPRGSWCSGGPTRPLVPRPASRPPWSRCTSHSHPAARAGRQAARSESPNVEAAERGGRGAPPLRFHKRQPQAGTWQGKCLLPLVSLCAQRMWPRPRATATDTPLPRTPGHCAMGEAQNQGCGRNTAAQSAGRRNETARQRRRGHLLTCWPG